MTLKNTIGKGIATILLAVSPFMYAQTQQDTNNIETLESSLELLDKINNGEVGIEEHLEIYQQVKQNMDQIVDNYLQVKEDYIQPKDIFQGIHGQFLDKVLPELKKNVDILNLYSDVHYSEQEKNFNQPIEGYFPESQFGIFSATAENLAYIALTKTGANIDDNLTELVAKLDTIEAKDISEQKKFVEMYNTIGRAIPTYEITHLTENITDVIGKGKGDCSEIASTYYSLLTSYGFDVVYRLGQAVNKTEDPDEIPNHIWLSAKIDDFIIDLDPTWHRFFTPLEVRNEDITPYSMKDEYINMKTNPK